MMRCYIKDTMKTVKHGVSLVPLYQKTSQPDSDIKPNSKYVVCYLMLVITSYLV